MSRYEHCWNWDCNLRCLNLFNKGFSTIRWCLCLQHCCFKILLLLQNKSEKCKGRRVTSFIQHELQNYKKYLGTAVFCHLIAKIKGLKIFFPLFLLVIQLLILLLLNGRKCRTWFSIIFLFPPKFKFKKFYCEFYLKCHVDLTVNCWQF